MTSDATRTVISTRLAHRRAVEHAPQRRAGGRAAHVERLRRARDALLRHEVDEQRAQPPLGDAATRERDLADGGYDGGYGGYNAWFKYTEEEEERQSLYYNVLMCLSAPHHLSIDRSRPLILVPDGLRRLWRYAE